MLDMFDMLEMGGELGERVGRLYKILEGAQRRCRYCAAEPFWCECCQEDRLQFLDAMADLLILLEPSATRRFFALLHAVGE